MEYKFESIAMNYEDYSSGRVLYSHAGVTSFPVRLASEIFLRCRERLAKKGVERLALYDPCCGGGYLLTVLGILHGETIREIYASDVNDRVLETAKKNLSLLSAEGMEGRIRQLREYLDLYGKPSHEEALTSARKLLARLGANKGAPAVRCFNANVLTDREAILDHCGTGTVNLLISDIPYGDLVEWQGLHAGEDPVERMLDTVYPLLAEASLAAVITNKKQKAAHPRYRRVERFKIGKREVTLLERSKPENAGALSEGLL